MKELKLFVLVAMAATTVVVVAASTASATTLGLPTGSVIAAEAEGTTILHPPIGDIECSASKVEGKTTNGGGSSETVKANIENLTFTGCNATVTVLTKGSLEIHTRETGANNNGTLTSSGTEVTVEFIGFHCIFKTSSTDIGTLTGSATTGGSATLDIEATIPRTGGRSGAFCGSTAQWTGSYKVTNPSVLNVDGESSGGGGVGVEGPFTVTVGQTVIVEIRNRTEASITIDDETVSDSTILEKRGSSCGVIAATGSCLNRELKCLRAGEATFTVRDTPDVVGEGKYKCDP